MSIDIAETRTPVYIETVEQNSDAWHDHRRGIPTGSQFGRIVNTKGLASKSVRRGYMAELIAAAYHDVREVSTADMEMGVAIEANARAAFSFRNAVDVTEVGFIYGDSLRMYGSSPDGLLDDNGVLEIKVPRTATHVAYLDAGVIPAAYRPQVYGELFCSDREFAVFCSHSYQPDCPPLEVTVLADDADYVKWANTFDTAIWEFIDDLQELRVKCGLHRLGESPQKSKVWD